jgi:hypothetical protein
MSVSSVRSAHVELLLWTTILFHFMSFAKSRKRQRKQSEARITASELAGRGRELSIRTLARTIFDYG